MRATSSSAPSPWRGDPLHPLDRRAAARAGRGLHKVQRIAPPAACRGCSPALIVQADLRELEAVGVVKKRERLPGAQESRRLSPDPGRTRPAAGDRSHRHVGPEMGRDGPQPRKPRSRGPDVGHAAQPQHRTGAERRTVIEFIYPELPGAAHMVADRGARRHRRPVHVDPGFDVDLFVNVDLRTMTEIWMRSQNRFAARWRTAPCR